MDVWFLKRFLPLHNSTLTLLVKKFCISPGHYQGFFILAEKNGGARNYLTIMVLITPIMVQLKKIVNIASWMALKHII